MVKIFNVYNRESQLRNIPLKNPRKILQNFRKFSLICYKRLQFSKQVTLQSTIIYNFLTDNDTATELDKTIDLVQNDPFKANNNKIDLNKL